MNIFHTKVLPIFLLVGSLFYPFSIKAEMLEDAVIFQEGQYGHPSQFNTALRDELLQMEERDQKARSELIGIKIVSEELWATVQEIDNHNGQRLISIIDQYGWPGVSLVGNDGTKTMWLLVQHQDLNIDFQKKCLELLKIAVDQHEAPSQALAYLTDRVNMNEGKLQIYGTQWTQEDGKICLYPVEDIDHLEERRSDMGLSTMAEYKEKIQLVYLLTDADFK